MISTSTSCCLHLYPKATSKASIIPTTPPQPSLEKNKGSWKRPCVVIGVASCFTIIGLQFNNSVISRHEALVPKEEIMVVTMSNLIDDHDFDDDDDDDEHEHVVLVRGVAKWSQKRMCPSWQGNNPLETIVPENLPRPAARRRYEAVRSDSKTAPPLSLSVKVKTSRDDCFSM